MIDAFKRCVVVAPVLALLSLASCLPTRFVIDLAPSERELTESVVIDEERTAGARVVLIDVAGSLSLGAADAGLLSSQRNVVDRVVARLQKAELDRNVKAVLLRINSPGGTVAASETLYDEIVRFRERTGRPVVVSMGEIATSGGYYVALAADRVYAQEATVTGSIGVIIQTFNVSDGLSRIGVDGRSVVSRSNKDIANPFEPMREEHYAILQNVVDEFYEAFRSKVRERRPGIEASRFDELTDGRVLPGGQAAAAGLVDGVAELRDAFESAKRLAGVERADLVAYSPEGLEPATLYAGSAEGGGGGSVVGPIEVSVIDAGGGGGGGVGPRLKPGVAYYIWAAAAE